MSAHPIYSPPLLAEDIGPASQASGCLSPVLNHSAPGLNSPKSERTGRAHEIDGIRGWASLVVMLFHVFWEMLGVIVPQIRSPASAIVLAGDYAVLVFFILSGDALATPFFATGQSHALDRLVVKRYPRLTLPITISCFLIWMLIASGADWHVAASERVHREDWIGKSLQITPTWFSFLRYSLYGVYADHHPETSFNPFLWTMSVEMVGSGVVFLACYSWKSLKTPVPFVIGIALYLVALRSFYSLFLVGVLLSWMRNEGLIARLRDNHRVQFGSLSVLFASAILIGLMWKTTVPSPMRLLISMVILVSIYTNQFLCRFFSNSLSRYLGKISFALYLIHFPVMISLMSYLIVHEELFYGVSDPVRYLVIGAVTSVACVAGAHILMCVEQQLLRLIDSSLKRYVLA